MAPPFVRSSLRRLCAPTGALALLGLILAAGSLAATPSPDPPPQAVAPEAPPVARTQPAPVRSAQPTVVPVRVVHPAAGVVPAQPPRLPVVKSKPVVKPKPTKTAKVTKGTVVPASAVPHDRGPVPLAAFVPAVEELNRSLAAFAGLGLAFVAFGGTLVLVAARRELAR